LPAAITRWTAAARVLGWLDALDTCMKNRVQVGANSG